MKVLILTPTKTYNWLYSHLDEIMTHDVVFIHTTESLYCSIFKSRYNYSDIVERMKDEHGIFMKRSGDGLAFCSENDMFLGKLVFYG